MRFSRTTSVLLLGVVAFVAVHGTALAFSVKLADVPWISQVPPGSLSQTHNCGQTSVYMVWGYYNQKTDDQLVSSEIVSIDDWLSSRFGDPVNNHNGSVTSGNKSDRLPTLANEKYGFSDSAHYLNWTIGQLQSELSLGHPVIVGVWTYMQVGGPGYPTVPHWMVLVGMDDSSVWVNDPGRSEATYSDGRPQGRYHQYSIDQFKASWNDRGSEVVVIKSTRSKPPLAGFTMSGQGTTRTDGSVLTLISAQAVPVILSSPVCPSSQLPVGCSVDPNGSIASLSWTITGLGTPLSGTPTTVSFGPGTYTVVLTATDNSGASAQVAGTIKVLTPASAGLFDGSTDVRFSQATFGEPTIDANGNLWVISYQPSQSFGMGDVRLNKIGPDGTPLFQSDVITAVIPGSAGLLVAASRVYVWDRYTVHAYDLNGAALGGGWPVTPGEAIGPAPVFDTFTGHTYVKTNFTIVAYYSDGFEITRQSFPEAAFGASRDYPLLQGPSDGLFTIISKDDYWPFANSQKLIGFSNGLVPFCWYPANWSYGWILSYGPMAADENGVYGSFRSQITSFDLNCNATTVFSSNNAQQILLLGIDSGYLFTFQYVNQNQFIGISVDGAHVWQQSQFIADSQGRFLHASGNGQAYGVGLDTSAKNIQTLFAVESTSGVVSMAIPTTGMCDNCGVAVSCTGAVYLNDMNSTRIYKVQ